MIEKLTSTKGIALLLSALLVAGAAGPAAAAVLDEQTVTVDDPDAEEIEATVELSGNAGTNNVALELVNDTDGSTVETVALEGSSGDTVTETFTVNSSGNYTVSLTADTTGVATLQSAETVDSATGLFGSSSKDQQFLWFGGVGAVAVIGVLGYREYNDDY
ncbi:hypothetical protein [Halovenus sp. HT40]|uniref:hypothetical protein n=1 Tax=Halovenus sp. HT40 TaxID=3126691 RepID=UPI00300F2576